MMTLKLIFAITFQLLCLNLSAQKVMITDLQLNDSTIYFFTRGPKSEKAVNAIKWNLQDKFSTHVGIGYFDGKQLKIYNVIKENPEHKTFLKTDSLESFLTSETYYFAMYKCNNKYDELMTLQAICENFSSQKGIGDITFKIESDIVEDSAAFCATVMMKINPVKYNYVPVNTSGAATNRKTLTYFPVDFFQSKNNCSKTFEIFIGATD